MHRALTLLGELAAEDLDWLLETGERRNLPAGSVLLSEGERPQAVWILLEGVFSLSMAAFHGSELTRLGPGEMVGEMSYLSGEAASATITTLDECAVLAVHRKDLDQRVSADPVFAARLYRAFALLAQTRLRERVAYLADWRPRTRESSSATDLAWHAIDAALGAFKGLIAEADQEALSGDGEVSQNLASRIRDEFLRLGLVLNEQIGDESPLPEPVREELGRRVQAEFLPYLLLAENAERYYSKPRGYAGDFFSIERMYENRPSGTGRLGPVIDSCFLGAPSARAVRNRRNLLSREIMSEVNGRSDRAARVTSLACGPAREIFDVFDQIDDKSRLEATLVDIDYQALAFVADRCDRAGLRKSVRLLQSNLVYLALGRDALDLEPQDLIYSIGLIDYFEDRFVVLLLDWIHDLLAPGGRTIVGNFHPRSPVKAIMDHILDWRLIHRTEEDVDRIFAASKFGRVCTRIQTEDEGINLFAECQKPPAREAGA